MLPVAVDAFRVGAVDSTVFGGPMPSGANPVTSMRIQPDGLYCQVPPCTMATIKAIHRNRAISAEAFNAAGAKTGAVSGTDQQDIEQDLTIDAHEITTLKITGGGGEGFLLGATAKQTYTFDIDGKAQSLYYRGILDLGLEVDLDEWGVVLYVQTVDNSSKDADPIKAAKNIGGIVESANLSILGCGAVMLLDHVFDVI